MADITQPTGGTMVQNDPNKIIGTQEVTGSNPGTISYGATNPLTGQRYEEFVAKPSTTTLSNTNKMDAVPGIVATTQNLSNTGIQTDANGNAYYANGTQYNQDQPTEPPSSSISQGGYVGSMYYPPGSQLPTDENGSTLATSQYSTEDQQIMDNINQLKAQSDSHTADLVDSLKAQYENLINLQKTSNEQQQRRVNTALLKGGVTGGGGSAQYAPISSSGIMGSQASYGIQQIKGLVVAEENAIAAAKVAGDERNYKLMDALNKQLAGIKQEKVKAITEMNKQVQEQTQKLAEQELQTAKDNAISELYLQGVTNPAEVLAKLREMGLNTVTLKDIKDTLGNINTEGPQIQELANTMSKNGASDEEIQKVLSSRTYAEALKNSGGWLGKLSPEEKLNYQVKQADLALKYADLAYKQKQTSLLGQPTPAQKKAEAEALKSKSGQVGVLKDKIATIDALKASGGLSVRVGPNFLSRQSPVTDKGLLGFVGNVFSGTKDALLGKSIPEFTGQGNEFAGGVHQLASQEFIDALVNAKRQGATFGSLTEREGEALRNAATKINAWEIKDNNGNPLGVWNVTQEAFNKELDTIKANAQKAIDNSGGIISQDEESLLDNIYSDESEDDVSSYFPQ